MSATKSPAAHIPDSPATWNQYYQRLNEANERRSARLRAAPGYSNEEVDAILEWTRAVVWAAQDATGMNIYDLLGRDWHDAFYELARSLWREEQEA